jgi:hypothetical protein
MKKLYYRRANPHRQLSIRKIGSENNGLIVAARTLGGANRPKGVAVETATGRFAGSLPGRAEKAMLSLRARRCRAVVAEIRRRPAVRLRA